MQRNSNVAELVGVITSAFAFSGVRRPFWGVRILTQKCIGLFFFIHPGTWFQKSVFSGSENAGSVWTDGRNAQDVFTKKWFPCGQGLSSILSAICFGVQMRARAPFPECIVSLRGSLSSLCDHRSVFRPFPESISGAPCWTFVVLDVFY